MTKDQLGRVLPELRNNLGVHPLGTVGDRTAVSVSRSYSMRRARWRGSKTGVR
jgi:hypothetical protein